MKRIPFQCFKKPWGPLTFAVIIMILLLGILPAVRAQNITRFEYFFDTDPGFGLGTSVAVTPAPDIDNLNVNLDLTGLSPGFHAVGFRAIDDSGAWSHTHSRFFYKYAATLTLPNIIAGEYFIDNDPGLGLGTGFTVTPGTQLTNLGFAADITALSPGIHTMYARVKDANSHWSICQNLTFVKSQPFPAVSDIVAAEYFLDSDPGFGNGTAVPVTPSTLIDNLNFSFSVAALSPGIHSLYARVKDASGNWSLCQNLTFLKSQTLPSFPDIVEVEYFLDNDPGFGSGTPVPVSPSILIDNLTFSFSITNLSSGIHNLFVRAKDATGHWSLVQTLPFYKESVVLSTPLMTQMEYFFDTDPGWGSGVQIPINPDTNLTVDVAIDVTSLSTGFHNLFIRAKDVDGRWSLSSSRPIYKEAFVPGLSKITKVEYFFDDDPGYENANNVPIVPGVNKSVSWSLNINSLSAGFHNLFVRVKDSTGKWSLTSARPFFKENIPAILPDIKRVEYYIDTDPGFGNATMVPLSSDTTDVSVAFEIDIQSLSQGFHQLFVRTKNSLGKWSLTSVRPFCKQITYDTLPDLVQIEYFYDNDPGFGSGIQVPVAPMPNIPFKTWPLNLNGVPFGQHMLYIRTLDEYGKWSLASRDTIFYYLDSLPTASLSGPIGGCINSTIDLEVTLTGTAPWTLIYQTGEGIDTTSGIMVTPFVFTVSPTFSGPHTAQVLKVQDAYYTGLYTGIPIEYQVYPLPQAAGTIYGPDHICQGTGSVWYSIYGVTNATSYSWTVPEGAAIVSSYNSSSILVDFSGVTASGIISVTPLNACGQGAPSMKLVQLNSNPVVDAGDPLFLPYQGSDTLFPTVTGGTPPYSYYWSPWYYFNNAYTENPIVSPPVTTSVSVQVTDANGCSGSDQTMVYVGEPQGTIISGNLNYKNALNTPMNNSTVRLKQNGNVVASATTGSSGEYSISGVTAGYYYLSGTSSKPWGGVNATDALLVLQDFAQMVTLTGLRKQVADVNASGLDNASDALMIASRYVGNISSFPLGDWLSDNKYLYAAGVGAMTENLQILCVGDVDMSYIPEMRTAPSVNLINQGEIAVSPGKEVEIPLLAGQETETGAVSLSLTLPDGMAVRAVRTSRSVRGEQDMSGNLLFRQTGQNLRIAWYDVTPLTLEPGEVLFWISLVPGERLGDWTVNEESVISNGMGQTLSMVDVKMPKLIRETSGFTLEPCQPNPFVTQTLVSFNLPEDGKASLYLSNALGQRIKLIFHESMSQGRHQVIINADDLPSGIYYCTLEFKGLTQQARDTQKLVVE